MRQGSAIGPALTVLATISMLGLAGCGNEEAPPARHTKAIQRRDATDPSDKDLKAMPEETTATVSPPAIASAIATAGPITLADYFPLSESARWKYDVELIRGRGEPQPMKAERRIAGTREIGAHSYHRFVTDISGLPEQAYRLADDGVYVAVQGAPGKEMLILPADPGQTPAWSGEAMPAVAVCSGTALAGQTVQCGEHRYDNCVKVVLTMTILEKSFFGGQSRVPARFERWFAPHIGLVREVRVVGEEGQANYTRIDSALSDFLPDEGP